MNLRPLGDRIIVKPVDEKEASVSGIILPDPIDKQKPERGEVVAVGPGRYDDGKLVPVSVKIGDIVVFKKYSPDEIEVEKVDYLILSESDILAVIE